MNKFSGILSKDPIELLQENTESVLNLTESYIACYLSRKDFVKRLYDLSERRADIVEQHRDRIIGGRSRN